MKISMFFIAITIPFIVMCSEQTSSSYARKNNCGTIKRLLFQDYCQCLDDLDGLNEYMMEVRQELDKVNEDLKKMNDELKERGKETLKLLKDMNNLAVDINANLQDTVKTISGDLKK